MKLVSCYFTGAVYRVDAGCVNKGGQPNPGVRLKMGRT